MDEMNDILTVHKDFGSVICGKEVTEIFELNNDKNTTATLSVTEDDVSFFFEISPRKVHVSPGKKARFKITFISTVPDSVYVKRYIVTDGAKPVAELSARCKSLGPSIRPKQCRIKFFVQKSGASDKKRFEMENSSICPAKFQFERGNDNRPFYFSKDSGLLGAKGKFVLDIKFMPSRHGVYCKKIYCLVQYHEPILLTLIGLYNPKLKVPQNKISFNKDFEEMYSSNYEGYLSDLNEEYVTEEVDPCTSLLQPAKPKAPEAAESVGEEDYKKSNLAHNGIEYEKECSTVPAPENAKKVILSNYFLNMRSKCRDENGIKLVNTSDLKEFFYEWSNDNGKNFSVTPKSGNLKENEIADMKIDFVPGCPDRFFNGELEIRIFPRETRENKIPAEIITLPRTLNLSIIGHSFPPDCCTWLEQCEIEPREVHLPPCVPGQTVYTTLLIRRRGQLPVAYEFLPPEGSCIKIKPPMGYVTGSYQLLIVQFKASTESRGDYTESWRVIFNDKTDYFGAVPIHAKIEEPIIILGVWNSVTFDTVLPCGISKSSVPVRNPTSLKLEYELCVPECMDWIEVPVLNGEIEPLSSDYIEIIFKPLEMKEYLDYICCCAKALQMPECKTATKVELRGSCQDGFLVATPAYHDFGKCLCGTESRKKFNVFNFTPVLMHFKLYLADDGIFGGGRDLIKVFPEKGSIGGKSNIEVEVFIKPNRTLSSKYSLKCQLLASDVEDAEDAEDALLRDRTLITFEIEGILPTFQIIDLNIEGGGPLMSPDWLWKMMDINGLNGILREIQSNTEKALDIRLPEAEACNSPTVIYLLIETKNLNEMTLEFWNKHRSHFSNQPSWASIADCSNFNFMGFAPSKMCLKPVSREIVKLALSFEVVGTTIYEWVLSMSQNRVIRLRGIVNALPTCDDRPTCAFLGPDLNLKPVCVGDFAPPVQLYWLYNNSRSPTMYVVDKTYLRECFEPFRIFNCLNSHGIVPPFSTLPLIFTFRPNELKCYEANVQVYLKNDYAVTLNLRGSGILNFSQISEFSHEKTVPDTPILRQGCIALESSVKVFTIAPFSTFSNIQRIFFLKNTSKENVWAFHWHSFNVENMIKASVEPSDGKIEPGGRLFLTLTIESFKFPTNITFSVPCDAIDFTALEAYERAVKEKEKLYENYKDCFTITEKGTFNEIPDMELPEKPRHRHIFVAVRTNIVSGHSLEAKLYPKDIEKLPTGRKVASTCREDVTLDEELREVVETTLEKILWKTLCSPSLEKQLRHYQECFGDVIYPQIIPDTDRKRREVEKRLRETLPKNVIESVLESTMRDILKKIFYEGFK